jgi:hypothetical protein
VGTSDNQPLEIHANNARVMRYSPAVANANKDTSPDVLGGDAGNTVGAAVQGATIAGGGGTFDNATVGPNSVQGDFGTIGGGFGNTVNGGIGVSLDGTSATIAGGDQNVAGATGPLTGGLLAGFPPGQGATVGGGIFNKATGLEATVAGGNDNVASGSGATVAGGLSNTAAGDASFAAGTEASAANTGSFVWSDTSGLPAKLLTFPSIANNEFAARATGGFRFVTAIDGTTGAPTNGCEILPSGELDCGTFSAFSDRAMKAGFEPVAASDVLKRVAALPLTRWSFKGQTVRHIGPMAQDFHAAFKVGQDDKHISTTDAEGVALAAIQGLYQKLEAKDAQLAQQKKQIESLSTRLEKLERETQASRNAAAMHPASALQPPRPSPVSRF